METRKLMKLGKSSLVVSLPKQWLKSNNLTSGDLVSVDMQRDGSIVVHPEIDKKGVEREIELSIEDNESNDSIIRRVIGAYLNGYTVIKLKSEKIFTENQQKTIRSIVSTLYMMIVESESSSIILQTLIDEFKVSAISGIERMHLITYSMGRDTINSLKNWDEALAKSALSLEDDVDQLMYFLLRLIRGAALNPSLANQMELDPLDCLDYQTLVHRIERIADYITNIAESTIVLSKFRNFIPEDVSSVLIEAAEISLDSYDMAVHSFFSKELDKTNDIIDKQLEIKRLCTDITPLPLFDEPEETSILLNIIIIRESIIQICHYTADIAELTIDRKYKS